MKERTRIKGLREEERKGKDRGCGPCGKLVIVPLEPQVPLFSLPGHMSLESYSPQPHASQLPGPSAGTGDSILATGMWVELALASLCSFSNSLCPRRLSKWLLGFSLSELQERRARAPSELVVQGISRPLSNASGGLTPFSPPSELQEIPVATREQSGVLCFHSTWMPVSPSVSGMPP